MPADPNSEVVSVSAVPPLYVFSFTITGGEVFGGEHAFYLSNGGWLAPDEVDALGSPASVIDASGLISTIASYLTTNGWAGGAVSDLSVTLYNQTGSDVTPT